MELEARWKTTIGESTDDNIFLLLNFLLYSQCYYKLLLKSQWFFTGKKNTTYITLQNQRSPIDNEDPKNTSLSATTFFL